MDLAQRRSSQRLQLDGIPLNSSIAKKLPPRLAFGYHVVPLAIEKNRVTVAMADPENKFAVDAIKSALGVNTYIVKSDQTWIDRLLVEVWPEYQNNDLRILHCITSGNIPGSFSEYSKYIRKLFKIPASNIYTFVGDDAEIPIVVHDTSEVIDLVILNEAEKSRHIHSMVTAKKLKPKQQMGPSILLARQPIWPIKKILLVLRNENRDHIAVDWILKMSLPKDAIVTILVPIPQVPRMYQGFPEMEIQIHSILRGNSALGELLRSIIARLESQGREVHLHILEGAVRNVIQQEVVEDDHDLIAIAAEPESWFIRRLMGSIIDLVLDYARRPIFIAKSLSG
jgi:nucleotide-binding universal stress UspA family protein